MEDIDMISQLLIGKFKLIDLSRLLEEGMPAWPTHARFSHTLFESYEWGNLACHYGLTISEHTGTHMDAPLHFISSGAAHRSIDAIDLRQVFGRAACMDVSFLEKNALLGQEHIVQWEQEHGVLKNGDIVLLRFGWEDLWDKRPNDRDFMKDWPGVGKSAADYFVEKSIRIVGTDAMAIDSYDSTEFPAHYTLLGSQILVVENLCNLSRLPAFILFFAAPLRIADGSGSPVRAFALAAKNPVDP